MISTPAQIRAFDPSPGAVQPTKIDRDNLTTDERATVALANGHPKSHPVKVKKGMEGERTGLMHLSPRSTRFIQAHAARGTTVHIPGKDHD